LQYSDFRRRAARVLQHAAAVCAHPPRAGCSWFAGGGAADRRRSHTDLRLSGHHADVHTHGAGRPRGHRLAAHIWTRRSLARILSLTRRKSHMNANAKPKRPLLKRTSIRILLVLVTLLVVGFLWLLKPAPLPPMVGNGKFMQAIVHHEYG